MAWKGRSRCEKEAAAGVGKRRELWEQDRGRGKMAREREMQDFIRSLFRGGPDLSVLTHSIVRQKYLAHVGLDHLDPEDKKKLKRLVEEELLKMQVEVGLAPQGLVGRGAGGGGAAGPSGGPLPTDAPYPLALSGG